MNQAQKRGLNKILLYLFAGIGFLISIYPFYWMFTASTLSDADIFKVPPRWLPGTQFFENLTNLQNSMPVWRALFNSIFVSGVTTISTVFFSALAGFAFAKYKFKGREILFFLVLLTMMIPIQITMVPMFIIMMNCIADYETCLCSIRNRDIHAAMGEFYLAARCSKFGRDVHASFNAFNDGSTRASCTIRLCYGRSSIRINSYGSIICFLPETLCIRYFQRLCERIMADLLKKATFLS
jgi:hypothetical protein